MTYYLLVFKPVDSDVWRIGMGDFDRSFVSSLRKDFDGKTKIIKCVNGGTKDEIYEHIHVLNETENGKKQ